MNLSCSLRKICLLVLSAIVLSLFTACSGVKEGATYQYQAPEELGDGWKTASLADAGLDSEQLAAMMDHIQDGDFDNLHSLLIVKDGRLVFEEYFRGHNQSSIDDVASVTKSITSIAIGIAIEQGFIKGPDQYLSDLLPSYADIINADPLKKKLQLWHLLTMTSGIDWDEKTYPYGDLKNDATKMERSPDPVRFILNRTVIHESGTQFQYSAANSMLLSAILQEATGMPLVDFANSNLFAPLGISRYRWDTYPDGHTNTDGGLSLRPRDMAKIGQLMLNKGQWNDVQIISPEWVSESTQAHTTVMPGIRYGYQWWRETQPILLESVEPYFAAGYGGQLITVYPDQNMIIIVTGQTANHDENISRFIYLRNNYLLPAAISASLSKIILWSWYTLTLGGLVALVIEIAKGNLFGFGWSTCWLLIGALFGPLGLIVYVLSYRNRQTVKASGWKALGIATFLAAGTIFGIILLTLYQTLFLPDGSVFLLVVPVSFLVSWLIFIAPLAASTTDKRYWITVRQTLLTAFISTCFVFVVIFPALIFFELRWHGVELTDTLFWVMMTGCGIIGTMAVYPFSLWMTRRNLDFWPHKRVDEQGTETAGNDKRLGTLRDAWGALLLGLILFIATFGFIIISLS